MYSMSTLCTCISTLLCICGAVHLCPYSGPSLFMVLTKHEAITGWRALMGPVDPLEAKEQDPNW